MNIDTFFDWIRQYLIGLMNRELTDLGSAKVQTTTWIRFRMEVEDENGIDRVEKPFNSKMIEIHQGSDLNEIVIEMLAHMKMQIKNPSFKHSRFRFDEVLFLDINLLIS